LMGHIYTHKYLMEHYDPDQGVSLSQAAANWYDNVYRPAVTLIRKHRILDLVPGRTEGDLYLWLVDHLREVREQYGEQTTVRKFSDALVDFLQDRKMSVPDDLLEEKDDSVILARADVRQAIAEMRARQQANDVNEGEDRQDN
jgi:hypothetical protein